MNAAHPRVGHRAARGDRAGRRPIATAPGVPAERVKTLREAFHKMIHDPKFLEIAERERFEIDYVPGEEMQQIVAEIVDAPENVRTRLKQIVDASGK